MFIVVQVYIVTGGSDGTTDPNNPGLIDVYLSSTETLTAGSSEWVEAGALPSARQLLRGVTIDNQFYVLGKC